MGRQLILLLIGLNFFNFKAQKNYHNDDYFRPGLVKASATITPGRILQNKANSIYINGFLEYVVDYKYSFRGEIFQFVDAKYSVDSKFRNPNYMNRIYFGSFRNLGKKNFKITTGAQMGVLMTDYDYSSSTERQFYVAPSFALKAGAEYYVWDYFHFFANLTYANSAIRGTQTGTHKMDEILFSAGLGFQINTIKIPKRRTGVEF
jgi:hypothetical protein